MKFQDQIAVVTGGGQGIGRSVARAFAAEGATVVIADMDEEAGRENEAYIREAGGNAVFIRTDVAQEEEVKALFSQIQIEYGRVDILVNNAGIGAGGSIFTRSMAEWDRVLAVNLRGPYMCARYAGEMMAKAQQGVILNISSTRALMSEADTEPYSASKGGLLALTHSLAVSLGRYGIRVNCICPGWIEVSAYKKKAAAKMPVLSERDHKQHPAGRVGKPEDIAAACIFLAQGEAGFITGANLVVDGGMTVKMIYEE